MSGAMIHPGISRIEKIVWAMLGVIMALIVAFVIFALWFDDYQKNNSNPSEQKQNKEMMMQDKEEDEPFYPPSLPGLFPRVKI